MNNEGAPAKINYPQIVAELKAMAETDQDMRKRNPQDDKMWDEEVDKRNTARMREIVATVGWPTISKYGERAAHAAWLLVQHADQDPEFQEKVLALMRDLPDGEVSKQDIAFLEDRVRVNTGRPTLYGTQFYNDQQGIFGPQPIEDRDTLDERRAAVGLGNFAEYEKEIREVDRVRQERMRAVREDK